MPCNKVPFSLSRLSRSSRLLHNFLQTTAIPNFMKTRQTV